MADDPYELWTDDELATMARVLALKILKFGIDELVARELVAVGVECDRRRDRRRTAEKAACAKKAS